MAAVTSASASVDPGGTAAERADPTITASASAVPASRSAAALLGSATWQYCTCHRLAGALALPCCFGGCLPLAAAPGGWACAGSTTVMCPPRGIASCSCSSRSGMAASAQPTTITRLLRSLTPLPAWLGLLLLLLPPPSLLLLPAVAHW